MQTNQQQANMSQLHQINIQKYDRDMIFKQALLRFDQEQRAKKRRDKKDTISFRLNNFFIASHFVVIFGRKSLYCKFFRRKNTFLSQPKKSSHLKKTLSQLKKNPTKCKCHIL